MTLYQSKVNTGVVCLNEDCKEEIFLLPDVGRHFVECGYKKTCETCRFVGKTFLGFEEHVCIIKVKKRINKTYRILMAVSNYNL